VTSPHRAPSAQLDLFSSPQTEPKGFRYRPDLIDLAQEARLAVHLAELPFAPFEFHGHLALRKVAGFGVRYDYDRRDVVDGPPIPSWLLGLREEVAAFSGHRAEAYVQVLINEYCPDAGVGWHRDKPQFEDVAGVSLLAPCHMRFRRKSAAGWERRTALLEPRSAYLLAGDARRIWEHSVRPVARHRYSITFRTLSAGGRPGRGP